MTRLNARLDAVFAKVSATVLLAYAATLVAFHAGLLHHVVTSVAVQ